MPLIYGQAEAMWSSQNDDSMKSLSIYRILKEWLSEEILQNGTSAEILETCRTGRSTYSISKLDFILKVKMYSCMERKFMFNAYHVVVAN